MSTIWNDLLFKAYIGDYTERTALSYPLPVINPFVTTTIIRGDLPPGLKLENNEISTIETEPFDNYINFSVDQTILFGLTIRAEFNNQIEDRDIYFTILDSTDTPDVIPLWYLPNNINLSTIEESIYYEYILPTCDTNSFNTTTSVISGKLPPGLILDSNKISGMPFEVKSLTTYKFVIRANRNGKISDRTFVIKIEGADLSNWITPSGLLPIGPNDSYYVLDESYVDFQLTAIDTDTIAGQTLSYWIDSRSGLLPPGLTLSRDGRIYGFIKPLLLQQKKKSTGFYDSNNYDTVGYDKGIVSTYGFGTYGYDFIGYDYSENYEQPRKLNRNYEFDVSISDGNTVSKRKFKIYVVGDDSFFTDNEVIRLGDTKYTSDITSLRDPIWITDGNLGTVRASNYQTLKLDIYTVVSKNPVIYSINAFNPDGSPSRLPPGMQFDSTTSEVFGTIPYQPAVTKIYNFTITATKLGKVRTSPASDSSENYPLKVDDIIIYRNYAAETNSSIYRDYRSLDYIDATSGIQIKKITLTSYWIYRNNSANKTYYSGQITNTPDEVTDWYLNELHTISVIAPSITLMPDSNSIYYDNYDTASSDKTFTLTVLGEIDNNISWITSSYLGDIETEHPCTFNVEAKCVNASTVNYSIIGGELPPGLKMDSLGQIYGKVNQFEQPRITLFDFTLDSDTTTIDRTYSFDVLASDIAKSVQIIRTFTIHIIVVSQVQFSDIVVRPLMELPQRELFRLFISNSDIFKPSSIYRIGDSNFGIQDSMSMLIFGGIETKIAPEYMAMVGQNHATKKFNFGDIKIAKAKLPGTHTVVYEVIYIEMVDPLEIGKNHLPTFIQTSKNNVPITIDNNPFIVTIDRNNIKCTDSYNEYKQPSSISLWRQRINDIGLDDRHYLPLWMRSIQDGSMVELDYIPAVTLCYCKPGLADGILLNIKNYMNTTGFDFNQLDYTIDRYIISATKNNIVRENTLQNGNTVDTVVLDYSASDYDSYYNGMTIIINQQHIIIKEYDGSTKQVTLSYSLPTIPLDNTPYKIQLDSTDKYIYFHNDRTQIS